MRTSEESETLFSRNVVYDEVRAPQVGDPPAPATPAASLSHPDCGMEPAEEGSLRAKMVGCNGLPPQTGQGPFGIGDEGNYPLLLPRRYWRPLLPLQTICLAPRTCSGIMTRIWPWIWPWIGMMLRSLPPPKLAS